MILLTGAHCPKCNDIKKYLDKRGLLDKLQQIDVNGEQGQTLVDRHDIERVPCFIVGGEVKYYFKDILNLLR